MLSLSLRRNAASAMPVVQHRIDSLDLLRGWAALFVAWFHIYQKNDIVLTGAIPLAICHYTSFYGYLGVPAFFIISGYIIPYATRKVDLSAVNSGLFLAKRAVRLLPTLAFVTLLSVIVAHLATLAPTFGGQPLVYSFWNVLTNVLLIAPLVDEPWILPVYWSLLIEAQYYIAFVLVMSILPRDHAHGWLALLGLLVVLPLITPRNLHSIATWSPCFAIGIAVFLQQRGSIGAAACMAVIAAGSIVMVWAHGPQYLVAIALTLACLYNRGPVPAVFVWLGKISYSLYLVHYLVGLRAFRLFARFGEGDWYYLSCYAAAMLASVLAAWIVFKLIEEPTMHLASSIGYRPTRPAAIQSVT